MGTRDNDLADRIARKVEKIRELEVEVARRNGVAEEKRKGLEIESVESMRLFRQASGYLLRIVDLQTHFEYERNAGDPHVGRTLGHIDDYNQLLEELKTNPTFKTTVEPFKKVSYERKLTGHGSSTAKVTIGNQTEFLRNEGRHGRNEYPSIQKFVAPRMLRKAEQLENSLIGRCMSGK